MRVRNQSYSRQLRSREQLQDKEGVYSVQLMEQIRESDGSGLVGLVQGFPGGKESPVWLIHKGLVWVLGVKGWEQLGRGFQRHGKEAVKNQCKCFVFQCSSSRVSHLCVTLSNPRLVSFCVVNLSDFCWFICVCQITSLFIQRHIFFC